jgi:hypothetical protein
MCCILCANFSTEPRIHDLSRLREVLMKTKYVCVEIVLLGTAVALALALLFATVGAAAGVAVSQNTRVAPSAAAQSFEGMISCSHCAAKHQPALDRSASTCVRVCVHGGAAFALIHDESVYLLEGDLGSFKKLAGQRARVIGTRTGNTIKVASITSAT